MRKLCLDGAERSVGAITWPTPDETATNPSAISHAVGMLHEGVTGSARPYITLNSSGMIEVDDRRAAPRVPFPAELVIAWFCAMNSPIRYRILDVSDGGFRILSNLPLFEGMTGVAMKILPDGKPVERTVAVAWIRTNSHGEHEAGLRLL